MVLFIMSYLSMYSLNHLLLTLVRYSLYNVTCVQLPASNQTPRPQFDVSKSATSVSNDK